MSAVARKSTNGIPEPEGFEVALSRKIAARSANLLRTVKGLDEDNDGYLSKKDLQDTLRDFFGVHLDTHQIDSIFARASMFRSSEGSEVESRNDEEKYEELITFTMFQKYVMHTSSDSQHPPSRMFESNMSIKAAVKTDRNENSKDKRSVAARTKYLKSLVQRAIQQSVPSGNFGMAASSIFLQMDTERNNDVTHAEFQHWIENKHGIHLTDEEMKLVFCKWVKDEGLTLQEFTYFMECFLSEYPVSCACDDCGDTQLSFKQRADRNVYSNQTHDGKSDRELIWALLNYFRQIGKTLAQAFYMLDNYGNKSLSAAEASIGFKQAGLNVSAVRSRALMRKFALPSGKMDLPCFVRMMTSEPIPDNVE